MRTLKFIVEGQRLRKDPQCNFDDLIPGSSGYLECEFVFNDDWIDCDKAASFFAIDGQENAERILGNKCTIPADVLTHALFYMSVMGQKNLDFKIKTNRITVRQRG